MKTNFYQRTSVPSAFITNGKQRLKQYENSVFLRNGEEFEIELFNPTSKKILAKIKFNGEYIDTSGIVLRPGERVFLERYFNEPKKFKFDTYFINSGNSDAVNAARNNGWVEVEFFEEQSLPISYTYHTGTLYSNNTGCPGSIGPSGITRGTNINYSTGSTSVTSDQEVVYANCSMDLSSPDLETGRVEKGSHSGQNFEYVNADFNFSCNWKCLWKLVPESRKPIMKEDLKIFCTNCGAKRKKDSHKFCPHCGEKF